MQTRGVIVFEDPVPARGRTGVWLDILAPLTEHPWRWAKIRTAAKRTIASSIANYLNNAAVRIPPGRWSFCSRGCDVFARFEGDYPEPPLEGETR